MRNFFEALEGRTLLSAGPMVMENTVDAGAPAVIQPLVVFPAIPGNYAGSVTVNGVHMKGVTVTLAKTAPKVFTGTLTATTDPSIHVAVTVTRTGKNVLGQRTVSVTLKGVHSGGVINGTGTGIINAKGKIKIKSLTFIQNGQPFPGALVLAKA